MMTNTETKNNTEDAMKTTGTKYEKDFTITEIAKLMRAEIKLAKKNGKLPASLKVSVRSRFYTGGRSIDFGIKNWEGELYTPEWVELQSTGWAKGSDIEMYAVRAKGVLKTLNSIWESYNYDNSDSMTDYHDVNYYGSVQFDGNVSSEKYEAILARIKSEKAEPKDEEPKDEEPKDSPFIIERRELTVNNAKDEDDARGIAKCYLENVYPWAVIDIIFVIELIDPSGKVYNTNAATYYKIKANLIVDDLDAPSRYVHEED